MKKIRILSVVSVSSSLLLWLPASLAPVRGQDISSAAGQGTASLLRVANLTVVDRDDANSAPRVASAPEAARNTAPATQPHPLDQAIEMAHFSLNKMRTEVNDYTALLIRREQIKGVVSEPSYMQMKVRCPRQTKVGKVPFSIYMKFLKPRENAGRECIWVDGANEGKIVAHEARGLIGMKRFYLEPTGFLAMRESRYPIYDAGIENLIEKLIEKAERDRAAGECLVEYRDNGEINGRKCDVIELCHPTRAEPFEFHKAQVFIDKETQLPIRYASYDWPEKEGEQPRLIEEYIYLNLKFNVGLSETDFSADNPTYKFPKH
jgi:hypothetical protein